MPAKHVDTHTYSWPGDPKLIMETYPGFVLYPCRSGKLDQDFGWRENTVGVLADEITPHIACVLYLFLVNLILSYK